VPKAKLPSSSDIDRSNRAEKEISKRKEGWGNNSKSWNSQSDVFMSRIEHNSEMIHNLTYKIDELKEIIEKLIKDSPPPPKE
jgi:exopolyphosphatase/pppGpp-phosphohydrolase